MTNKKGLAKLAKAQTYPWLNFSNSYFNVPSKPQALQLQELF
jgi:hypothetical protein